MTYKLPFLISAVWGVFGFYGWLLYFREHERSRDYVTDLMQVAHDYELTRDDLRRSLGYDEVEERLERWNDGA